jgi:hypothetical protein
MRVIRAALALLVVLGGVLVGSPPAFAGNWAVTLLDPVPERIEAGRAYTVGFWVLQHGSHPYDGKLDPVALKLVDAKGSVTTFPGTALPEAAHYATSMLLPASGTYTVLGVQGIFQDYKIGTLTVPGGLSILGTPETAVVSPTDKTWGAIRPPTVPVDPARDPFEQNDTRPVQVAPVQATQTPATAATEPTGSAVRPTASVLAALVVVAVVLGLLYFRRRRPAVSAPAAPAPPVSAPTVVSSVSSSP